MMPLGFFKGSTFFDFIFTTIQIIINNKITHNEENNSAGYGSIFEKSIAKKENNCIYKSLPSY